MGDVYPALSEQSTYSERATYILSKYGQTLAVIKQQLRNVLSANKDSTLNKMEIVDAYINKRKHVANKDEEDTKINEDNADDEKESNSHLKSNHFRIAIEESKQVIDATLAYEEEEQSGEYLSKSQFFLLYRKLAIVSPIMCRLELTELGNEQFRSGMIADRTKNLDKMAFNIQQLRNRYHTQLDERKRIEMATSPQQCAVNIESFIQNNDEPLDTNSNNSATGNLFRKRRPIKFPKLCHACCCCFVACVRCCE